MKRKSRQRKRKRKKEKEKAGSRGCFVAHRFDVVAIRIEHECTVVVGVIFRPQTWGAMVAPAGGERRAVKGIDLRTAGDSKGEVDCRHIGATAADPEIRLGRHTKSRKGAGAGHPGRNLEQQLI